MMNNMLSSDQVIIYIQSECTGTAKLNAMTWQAWWSPGRLYRNLLLIDQSFKVYKVCGCVRPKPNGWFAWFKWLLSPIYRVELIFDGPPRQSTLEECRELIYKAIELDPEFYESSRPMAEWKADLWLAQSFEELCMLIRCEAGDYARFQEKEKGSGLIDLGWAPR
jgi:hypothetical protein